MIICLSPTTQQSSSISQSEGSTESSGQSEADPLAVRPRDPELSGQVRGGVLDPELMVAVGVHARVAVAAVAAGGPRLAQRCPIVRNLGVEI